VLVFCLLVSTFRQISVRLTSETETSPCDVSRDISGRYFTNSNSATFSTSNATVDNVTDDINLEFEKEKEYDENSNI
jgi:hypothetical protein